MFSKHFGIKKQTMNGLGVFNPILNCDTKVFVEPLLLKSSSSQIMLEAFEHYKVFFAQLLKLLRSVKVIDESDIAWREAKRRLRFPEYKSTCIGYSSGTISGSGSGTVLNDKILQTAKEIINRSESDPDIFLMLPLLEEGIGADIISDMVQNIIDQYICDYTVDVMDRLGLIGAKEYRTKLITGETKAYKLLHNKYHNCPIKLLPLDILSNLPLVNIFPSWLEEQANINQEMRSQVNKLIGVTWLDATITKKKESLLDLLKADKDFFLTVLSTLQNCTFEHYDLEKDYEGLYRWLEDSKKFISVQNIHQLPSTHDKTISLQIIVETIANNFKRIIEEQDLWRIFWTKHYSKFRHVREFYSQMLFYMVGDNWCSAYGNAFTIDREFNKETKQLELIFNKPGYKKIIVQIKHSNNHAGLKKAYEEQIEQCKADNVQSFYLVLDFDVAKSKKLQEIIKIEDQVCKIIHIRAEYKESDISAPISSSVHINFGNILTEFDGVEEDYYLKEKRRGGANSYKKYKPLKNKVQELCKEALSRQKYPSALELCNFIAGLIEKDHQKLLADFRPYDAKSGNNWESGTFYNWCNKVYKAEQSISESS